MRRNTEYLAHFRDIPDRGRALLAAASNPKSLLFCYRLSPTALLNLSGRVSPEDPSPTEPGDAYLELAADGRLVELRVVPSRDDAAPASAAEFDWSPLFAAAGLEPARLTAAAPGRGPVYAFDRRAAWESDVENERVRVEAAARHGRATYFRVAPKWMAETPARRIVATPLGQHGGEAAPRAWPLLAWLNAALILGSIAFLTVLALHNLRLGRGDRRSAYRLSVFMAGMPALGEVLTRHWTLALGSAESAGVGPLASIVETLGSPLFVALVTWLTYVGLEPHVRRRWPHLLIASTRLLDGRLRDPLVGRSVLMGVLAAIASFVLISAILSISGLAGWGFVLPASAPGTLNGLVPFVGYLATAASLLTWFSLNCLAVLLLARLVLRSTLGAWIGLAALFLTMYLAWGRVFFGSYPAVVVPFALALAAASVLVFRAGGILAFAVFSVVLMVLRDTPWMFALTSWYARPAWFAAALIAGLAFWGFRNVLGRQSVFPAGGLED